MECNDSSVELCQGRKHELYTFPGRLHNKLHPHLPPCHTPQSLYHSWPHQHPYCVHEKTN
eukprot:1147823-Pelagomonas_calceolata.AAC.5